MRMMLTIWLGLALPAIASANLVIGIDDTSQDDIMLVDVNTDTSTSLFGDFPTWGLTADDANARLYSVAGESLYRIPYGTLTPELIGTVQAPGGGLNLESVTYNPNTGTLFGTPSSAEEEGVYEIDPTDATATLVFNYKDDDWDFGGFEYDAATNTYYGLNDDSSPNARGLYAIDPTAGTIDFVVAYPAGETDIDGLAIGDGIAYFVTDQSGSIYVYDLVGHQYKDSLTSPFVSEGTHSGAAWAPSIPEPATLLLLVIGGLLQRRSLHH